MPTNRHRLRWFWPMSGRSMWRHDPTRTFCGSTTKWDAGYPSPICFIMLPTLHRVDPAGYVDGTARQPGGALRPARPYCFRS
jgi:hypothetical protein